MSANEFINQIKTEIAKGEDLRKIFHRMEFLLKGQPKYLEVIHQSNRYEILQKEIRLGTLDYQTQGIERNKIVNSILSFLEFIESEIKDNDNFKVLLEKEVIEFEKREASSPNFFNWIKSNKSIKNLAIGFAIFYTIGLAIFIYFQVKLEPELFQKTLGRWNIPIIIHWLFILVVSFWLFRFKRFSIEEDNYGNNEISEFQQKKIRIEKNIRDKLRLTKLTDYLDWTEEEKEKLWRSYKKGVNKTIEQFSIGWFSMWALWAVFYGMFLCGIEQVWLKDFINYLGTATFLFMYLTLTITTTGRIIFSLIIKILLIITVITILQLYLSTRLGYNQEHVQFWFRLIFGLIACSVFSTVFGRLLDSKFVNTPILLSTMMYFYAAIQPLYCLFDFTSMRLSVDNALLADISIKPTVFFFVLSIAFYMKILLFLIITWILRTGRLLYFVAQEGSLNYKNDDEIKLFIQNISIEDSRLI